MRSSSADPTRSRADPARPGADRTRPGPERARPGAEAIRLEEDARREKNWKRWGPYLSERQWGTVREDYSAGGSSWDDFPHDHARSRAYRWGEDGLLGLTDRECRLCFALALWNGRDPILKERLFGLTNPEGNHGEDVKECYFYLDATPTYAYMKALYKYPQAEYPYVGLLEENRRRGREDREFEILDTGVFDGGRYFDVFAEYAKAGPDDVLIRITAANRGPEPSTLHVIPTLWFRNTWSWGCSHEGCDVKPRIEQAGPSTLLARHATLGAYRLEIELPAGISRQREAGSDFASGSAHPAFRGSSGSADSAPAFLFTDNETNSERIFGSPNPSPYVRDAFHELVVRGRTEAVNPKPVGTKAGAHCRFEIPPGREITLRLRLRASEESPGAEPVGSGFDRVLSEPFGSGFDRVFADRLAEADAFYATLAPRSATDQERGAMRQAYAGLLWSKQFYHYIVKDWLEGDPDQPRPPESRKSGRNSDWVHLYSRDVISMPDKWEYPWFAAWDLAFHMIPMATVDPKFAKDQLVLFLREWYMHPNGQIPAYELSLGDVNPPVHAWATWRVYKMTGERGRRDRAFLASVFQKLLINFTWWVNRKDTEGNNLFSGGFLGLDNIGVFDRSKPPLPTGGTLAQADGTAWMAFYCGTMLSMALELAKEDPAYEDMASKFFEHFVRITDAMNTLGGTGLWDETDGFYYDQLRLGDRHIPLRIRSMVGLIPLYACEILQEDVIERLPGFAKRMRWFLANRGDLSRHIAYMEESGGKGHRLLAIPSRDRLTRVLRYLLDESEFLSPYGIRSVSRIHADHPYVFHANGEEFRVAYVPGESNTGLFGGNSNWRGPIWFPVNYLLIEALERYHLFYGDALEVECPTGSGRMATLQGVAGEISRRLASLFLPDETGVRPFSGSDRIYGDDPHWRDLVLFHEYFHGDTGRGMGASHQTGWTALAARCLEDVARSRARTSRNARLLAATTPSKPGASAVPNAIPAAGMRSRGPSAATSTPDPDRPDRPPSRRNERA